MLFTFNFNVAAYAEENKKISDPALNTAVKPAAETDLFFLCRRDRSVRWLRAYKLENGKCFAQYSKDGYLQIIGSAAFYSSCEGILQSVKKNLEEGGFSCNANSKYSVLEL